MPYLRHSRRLDVEEAPAYSVASLPLWQLGHPQVIEPGAHQGLYTLMANSAHNCTCSWT